MLNLLVDIRYLIPKATIWILLFLGAVTDTIRHRHVKRRGHQLQRGVLLVLGVFILQDILLLSFAAQKNAEGATAQGIYLAYILFANLADSSFLVSACRLSSAAIISKFTYVLAGSGN